MDTIKIMDMNKSSLKYLAGVFVLLVLILWGLSSLIHAPKSKGMEIAANEFSAARAFMNLQDLIGNNKPHPSGSAENRRIRRELEQKFQALGYRTEIQSTLGCTPHSPGCTQVENIIVRHKGTGGGDAIMITTHYDSVPAGPGASDSMAGVVAMLEVARILKAGQALKNDVVFLITDGEEGGLRGASAFANQHPMFGDIKLVINLEARGVSGPSTMFETSTGNAKLIKTYARHAKNPVANSLSYEVYKRLPNNTDFSIYRAKGVAGLNYAFTGHVALYHSRYDDADHLDQASLQGHGDNALAALRAFGNEDLNTLIGSSNASYFDVFGKFLLRWPADLNIPLAILALLAIGFSACKSRPGLKKTLIAVAGAFSVIILTPLLGWVLSFPLGRWPDLFYLDHPHPWPGRLALIFGAVFVAWLVARIFKRWTDENALLWVASLIFALGALALAILMPGASYILLLPALGIALASLIKSRFYFAALFGLILTTYMAFYAFIAMEVIINYGASHLRIAFLVIMGLVLVPIFVAQNIKSKILGYGLAVITVVATTISFLMPGLTPTHPRAQNLVYVQGHEVGKAIWVSETFGKQDKVFLQAAGFYDPSIPENLYGVFQRGSVAKPATSRNYAPPSYILQDESVADGVREITLDIQSSHGGYTMNMEFDKKFLPYKIIVNGQIAADYTKTKYRRPVTIRAPGKDVFRVIIRTDATKPFKMALIDSFSLAPDQTDGMAALRPDISAPLKIGDRAHIFTHIEMDGSDKIN